MMPMGKNIVDTLMKTAGLLKILIIGIQMVMARISFLTVMAGIGILPQGNLQDMIWIKE